MAYLGENSSPSRNRAQLILLTGFALAISFVALAVLLNAVIFTENLATRSESARASQAAAVTADISSGGAAILQYANTHNTSSYSALEQESASGIERMGRYTHRQHLADGAVVNVTYLSANRGARISQSIPDRNFTDRNHNETWTLATGLNGSRAIRMNVTEPTALQEMETNTSEIRNYTFVALDGSDTWEMRVYRNNDTLDLLGGDSYRVETIDGNGNRRKCSVSDEGPFWINVSAGTVAGDDCRALRYGENLSTIDRIEFRNSHKISGTYHLMVDNESTIGGLYDSSASPPPALTPALYDATVQIEYETRTLAFETNVSVDPEAGDA